MISGGAAGLSPRTAAARFAVSPSYVAKVRARRHAAEQDRADVAKARCIWADVLRPTVC